MFSLNNEICYPYSFLQFPIDLNGKPKSSPVFCNLDSVIFDVVTHPFTSWIPLLGFSFASFLVFFTSLFSCFSPWYVDDFLSSSLEFLCLAHYTISLCNLLHPHYIVTEKIISKFWSLSRCPDININLWIEYFIFGITVILQTWKG